jgi:hypothetical protein
VSAFAFTQLWLIPILLQADADDNAEIAWITSHDFIGQDSDGTILTDFDFSTGYMEPSVQCAGDVDGDGLMDIISLGHDNVYAWTAAGVEKWHHPLYDLTGNWGGCTTFDFDLDGAKEVLFADMAGFHILDGATGDVRYTDPTYFTLTADDTPLVVDLDGDGSVEIVMVSPASDISVTTYRNVNRDWPPGTNMWPSSTWSGTSLLPDGSVPRTPQKSWLTTKVWKGQPELPLNGIDLRPATGDVCVASCADDGEVRVEVRLQNLGPDEAQVGAPLAVYGLDGTGARVLLQVLSLSDWLDDGRSAASWEVVTTTAQARRGLVFVAGDPGTGVIASSDCDATNNELVWSLAECP